MSFVVGFDYDSHAVYGALIDENTGGWRGRILADLDVGPGDAFDRVMRLRDLMPARTSWRDAGIVAIGIEATFSQGFQVTAALARVQGALLACLPRDLPVYPLTANGRKKPGWKLLTTGDTRSSKDDVKAWALEHGAPAKQPQDVYDAFAIARATLRIWRSK